MLLLLLLGVGNNHVALHQLLLLDLLVEFTDFTLDIGPLDLLFEDGDGLGVFHVAHLVLQVVLHFNVAFDLVQLLALKLNAMLAHIFVDETHVKAILHFLRIKANSQTSTPKTVQSSHEEMRGALAGERSQVLRPNAILTSWSAPT